MPISFPSNPSLNQTYTVGSRTWQWDGSSWKVVAIGRAALAQDTAPSNPLVGQMWFDTANGIQYTYFNDGTSSQWVETGWAGQLTNIAAGGGLTGTYPNPTVASISGLSAGGDLTGTYPNPTLAKGPTYVTSLPSSPIDGQEIYYAADATNGVIWHLRYRSGSSSSYKWEFVGGPRLSSQVASLEYTTSSTYTALTTAGPSITLPLAGDYDIAIGAYIQQPLVQSTFWMSYDIGATGAVDSDGIRRDQYNSESPRSTANNYRTQRKTGLSAVTLTAKYKSGGGGNCGWGDRTMIVTPVRVG